MKILLAILPLLLLASPVLAECDCHNVGVLTTIEPVRLNLEQQHVRYEGLTFNVTIYNNGNYVEEGISLKILERRTGRVLYYNPNQVPILQSQDRAVFDITVPVDHLSAFDCGTLNNSAWVDEGYTVSAFQLAYNLDCWGWDNYEYPYIKLKPLCPKA